MAIVRELLTYGVDDSGRVQDARFRVYDDAGSDATIVSVMLYPEISGADAPPPREAAILAHPDIPLTLLPEIEAAIASDLDELEATVLASEGKTAGNALVRY